MENTYERLPTKIFSSNLPPKSTDLDSGDITSCLAKNVIFESKSKVSDTQYCVTAHSIWEKAKGNI